MKHQIAGHPGPEALDCGAEASGLGLNQLVVQKMAVQYSTTLGMIRVIAENGVHVDSHPTKGEAFE